MSNERKASKDQRDNNINKINNKTTKQQNNKTTAIKISEFSRSCWRKQRQKLPKRTNIEVHQYYQRKIVELGRHG
jgi:hypothetical protein